MSSDFNAVLPTNIMRGAGVLVINGTTPFGSTDGGLSFDPGVTWVNRDFDGKTAPVEGQDYIGAWASKISGTVFPMSATKTGSTYMPGSASTTVSTLTTITSIGSAQELTVDTHYLADVRLIYPLVGGGWVWAHFAKALCTKWMIKGAKNNDAKIDIEIEARLDSGSALGACPYVIEFETGSTY